MQSIFGVLWKCFQQITAAKVMKQCWVELLKNHTTVQAHTDQRKVIYKRREMKKKNAKNHDLQTFLSSLAIGIWMKVHVPVVTGELNPKIKFKRALAFFFFFCRILCEVEKFEAREKILNLLIYFVNLKAWWGKDWTFMAAKSRLIGEKPDDLAFSCQTDFVVIKAKEQQKHDITSPIYSAFLLLHVGYRKCLRNPIRSLFYPLTGA